jgi:hypothetical protein
MNMIADVDCRSRATDDLAILDDVIALFHGSHSELVSVRDRHRKLHLAVPGAL